MFQVKRRATALLLAALMATSGSGAVGMAADYSASGSLDSGAVWELGDTQVTGSLHAAPAEADLEQEGPLGWIHFSDKTLENCPQKDGDNGITNVELSGTLSSTPMQQRSSGFREMIEGDERFHILETVSGDFLRSKGKECMQALLARHAEIDVLFSHNDSLMNVKKKKLNPMKYIAWKCCSRLVFVLFLVQDLVNVLEHIIIVLLFFLLKTRSKALH